VFREAIIAFSVIIKINQMNQGDRTETSGPSL